MLRPLMAVAAVAALCGMPGMGAAAVETLQSDLGSPNGVLDAQAWNVEPMLPVVDDVGRSSSGADFGNLRGGTWKNIKKNVKERKMSFPESALLKGRENTGFSLSGGGTRAYLASLGYLRGLLDLGLLEKTSYVSSVSGGTWANAAFTYFQENSTGISLAEFLGELREPSQLTMKVLDQIDHRSARASPVNINFFERIVEHLFAGMEADEIYPQVVSEVFLEPAGIKTGSQVYWNEEHRKSVLKRNPQLNGVKSVVTDGSKPFAIMNAALLGPLEAVPFNTHDDNYVSMEFNALYVGSPKRQTLEYTRNDSELAVGGYIETCAFNGKVDDPMQGMGPFNYTEILKNVPMPEQQFSLKDVAAASSFAPGSILSGSPLLNFLDHVLGMQVEYWSPITDSEDAEVVSKPVLVSDGASLENNGFLSLLRRQLDEIVVFIHSPIPLKGPESFNPFEREPSILDVDPALSCLFGFDNEPKNTVENLFHNQVFSKEAFPDLIDSMQTKARQGKGIVVRQLLTTIENEYWGIPAGVDVNITWVYLSRTLEWERQLPAEIRRHVQPHNRRDIDDTAKLASSGPFSLFPHYGTQKLHVSAAEANLLVEMTGWIIHQNKELFEMALNPQEQRSLDEHHHNLRISTVTNII